MDFRLDINENREIRILQLTDMQIIDGTQQRYEGRLGGWTKDSWLPKNDEKHIYSHVRYLVGKSNPDLIFITGDMIYGEFDDSGESLKRFINFLDSLEIPWAITFGNHDNESKMGITWQCEQIKNAKYSMFNRGNVYGNSNYTIGIFRNNELIRTLFMVDTNGCGDIGIEPGIHDDQLEWMQKEAEEIKSEFGNKKCFVCFHEPTEDFQDAYLEAGYIKKYDVNPDDCTFFTIGKDVEAKNGDFGKKQEAIYACVDQKILPVLQNMEADGVFAGHCHAINTSVLYKGIRFTFGYKTGTYDYHDKEAIGGTLITLNQDNSFNVCHLYSPAVE